MGWERASKYHETNGTHNVAAVKVLRLEDTNIGTSNTDWRGRDKGKHPRMGGEPKWMFEAWRKGKPAAWLGLFDTADEARKRCEGDVA